MSRDSKLYLDDIKDAINKIERYTKNISYEEFISNSLIIDGVIKNLLVIGEAVKHLPLPLKRAEPSIEWNKIAGFRDVLIHGYFNIHSKILWDVITLKLPELKQSITNMKNKL